jgi:phenol hydroxylase P1 protein
MTIEIKTSTMKPVRNTYAHIQRRFGDKPATRYQEATYDVHSTHNFHYKPLWDQERELNDPARTAVVMADWYDLKDPRQFYYGPYVQNRAKMQETAENNFSFFEKRGLAAGLDEALRAKIIETVIPMRHAEVAANLNNMYGTAHGTGTAVTQALIFEAMDRFGNAQYFSKIGLALDDNTGSSLVEAKQHWMSNPIWQGLRAYCEKTLTIKDWFEAFIAQDIVLDTLINDLYYRQFDTWLTANGGRDLLLLMEFMQQRAKESQRWSDSVLKSVVAESEHNANQIRAWISTWRIRAQEALAPLANALLCEQALAEAFSVLEQRLGKVGLGH